MKKQRLISLFSLIGFVAMAVVYDHFSTNAMANDFVEYDKMKKTDIENVDIDYSEEADDQLDTNDFLD